MLLAVAHSERWQVYLASALLGVGIGLAFASMSNLIVEAVSSEQTGVATGMNTIMRTVGGALGTHDRREHPRGQPRLSGLPPESAFVIAFVLSACALSWPSGPPRSCRAPRAAPCTRAHRRVGAPLLADDTVLAQPA